MSTDPSQAVPLEGELVSDGSIQPVHSEVVVVIPQQKVEQAAAIARQTDFVTVPGTTLVTFGNAPIVALSGKLNSLLTAVTKADNPVLFELFKQVSKAVEDLDIKGLEAEIRTRLSVPWWARILMALRLMNYAKWLQKTNDEVLGILEGRTKSLLDLITPMENKVATESMALVSEIGKMSEHKEAYISTASDVGMHVLAGRTVLEQARLVVEERERETNTDPMRAQETIALRDKFTMFDARVVALEDAYAKAPANVYAIQVAQNAGLLTLADTISSSQAEFNDIKSILLQLNSTYRIRSVQQLNTERRRLRAQLAKYMIEQLEETAITAASSLTDARLESAKVLAAMATKLESIGVKLEAEREKGKEKLITAKATLAEAQQSLSQLANPKSIA